MLTCISEIKNEVLYSHLSFSHFPRFLWSMQRLLGIFKVASLLYPSSIGFQNCSIQSVARGGGGGEEV